jgi:hypothetical protein
MGCVLLADTVEVCHSWAAGDVYNQDLFALPGHFVQAQPAVWLPKQQAAACK